MHGGHVLPRPTYLGPLHWASPLRKGNLGRLVDKIRISIVKRHVVRLEPRGNGRRFLPARRVDFVAAEVQEIVGKQARRLARLRLLLARHFPQQVGDEIKGFSLGYVERLRARRRRTQLGVTDAPRGRMPGLHPPNDETKQQLNT